MTRKSTVFLFLSAPVVAGALTIGMHYCWDHWLRPGAVFVYPESIDLGSRDRGEIAVARFEIHNHGNRELVVDQLATSCSCAGVEREVDGKYVRVSSVHVRPGGTADLLVRVGIGALVGDSQIVHVFCRSNDPAQPFGKIDVSIPLVTGGICTEPRAVVLGNVAVGETVSRVVDLYDAGPRGSRVALVRSTQPDRLDVRLLPLATGERNNTSGSQRKLVARLEVTAKSERPRQLDGDIEIYLADEQRPSSRISVTGEVVSGVRCWPSLVVLPRRVEGRAVFNNEILIQGREEAPLKVRVLSSPAGLRVDIRRVAGHVDRRLVFVEGKPATDSSQPVSELRIRLGVRSGEHREETIDIPISVMELPS